MMESVCKRMKEFIKNAVNARILVLLVNCVYNSIYLTVRDLWSFDLNSAQSLTRGEIVNEKSLTVTNI